MVDLTTIREDMEVVGSDGGHVGAVDRVLDGEIKLNRQDSEAEAESGAGRGHHHFIPIDWVERVDTNALRVELNLPKGDAEARWRHEG